MIPALVPVLPWQQLQFPVLLLLLHASCSGQSVYYVTPSPDTRCPGEPCHTLSEYATGHYFQNMTPNTTMDFLPGNHSLEQTISITNVMEFTLYGDASSLPEVTSRIVCTWPAGFVFTSVTVLHITTIGFISCGHNDSSAVSITSAQHLNVLNCIFQNNTHGRETGAFSYGGALMVSSSSLTLVGTVFQSNYASNFGGAVYMYNCVANLKNNSFQSNRAFSFGGALSVSSSNLNLTGNMFQFNSAKSGGALLFNGNTLNLTGNIFWKNSATSDGVVIVLDVTSGSVTANTFESNFVGALVVSMCKRGMITITGNRFESNYGDDQGGALRLDTCSLVVTVTENTFWNNTANLGGALSVSASNVTSVRNHFTDNSAQLGGAILVVSNSTVKMYGGHMIRNNTAQYGGGIAVLSSQLELTEDSIIRKNTASYGGGLYGHNAGISGKATFTDNIAAEGGGGVYAAKSTFYFNGNTSIMHNSAVDGNGGGLLLSGESKFYLQPNSHVNFIGNSAKSGGAIKIEEHNPLTYCIYTHTSTPFGDVDNTFDVSNSDCFFQIQNQTTDWGYRNPKEIIDELNVGVYFDNNVAADAGGDLHGGSIEDCILSNIKTMSRECSNCPTSGEVFDDLTSSKITLDISSDPLYVCTCKYDTTDCSGSYVPEPVFPGATLEIPLIACGQRNGTTVAMIQVVNTSNIIQGIESIQNINRSCTTLKYTIHSSSNQTIALYAEGPCPPTKTNTLQLHITIQQCPPGFQLSQFQPICVCAERLQKFTNSCQINDKTVLRPRDAEFWVGYDNEGLGSKGLILHPNCPFDYCTSKEIYMDVDDSDKQCNYNRSGLLCGKCGENLSLVLGSSRCLQCSDSYLALLPAFAFAGFALVIVLIALRLTVAAGTINGLIFYTNVLAVNSAVFFKPKVTNVLTVFIAWLNLDLGIETCFYNGMDAYVKTWLQFAFPLYVWTLVGIIILGSYYSVTMAKIFGSNPVAVLATLFLLSYAKLLRVSFAALSYTFLEYLNYEQSVWLHDGNVNYLGNKHVPLFIVAVVCLIFLFFPYTMLLTFSQWLQARSRLRIFSWINNPKIKPFLDAYHAPYTNKHRYWTGLMLLVRFILFLISAFSFNSRKDPTVNLLVVASVSAALISLLAILGNRVYKHWCLSLLELSFLLNLTILVVATFYVRGGGNQNAATYTSVGIAFTMFTGIVIYHSVPATNKRNSLV